MINISVVSDFMECKKRFKSDAQSIKFLKRVERLRQMHRMQMAPPKPKEPAYRSRFNLRQHRRDIKRWQEEIACIVIPIKIKITHE